MLRASLAFLFAKRVIVRESSMSPALLPDEYVLVDRLAYWAGEPGRGDIALAQHPTEPGMLILKRVVGLPGDHMGADERGQWVAGGAREAATGAGGVGQTIQPRTLGPDEYFLAGDALDLSQDSRHFGPVRRSALIGRCWLVYWPLDRSRNLTGGGRAAP